MIFATVGTQLPFPRLMNALDAIAGRTGLKIFAQTADARFSPAHIETQAHLDPLQFDEQVRSADILVAHAGIGTILTAKRFGKPLILFPRRAALNEHRNDHQLATVRALPEIPGIYIALDEPGLEALLSSGPLSPARPEASATRDALIERIRRFIQAA